MPDSSADPSGVPDENRKNCLFRLSLLLTVWGKGKERAGNQKLLARLTSMPSYWLPMPSPSRQPPISGPQSLMIRFGCGTAERVSTMHCVGPYGCKQE